MQITKDDLWVRTYGRLYQKLCSTTCEIPIAIYRTQDSDASGEGTYDNNDGDNDSLNSSADSLKRAPGASDFMGSSENMKKSKYSRCFHAACVSEESSLTSVVLTVVDEARDSHVSLIERAEIANLVRSRMQSLGLPCSECDMHISEKRSSLSYVIINPSCDLRIKEGDVVYLIRPSPFSAQKTFERHNSRRKSHLNNNGGSNNAEELQKAAFNIFQERRRSSAGSVSGGLPFATIMKAGVSKSNSLSLPDSPRQRSNSFRLAPADDILIRRSNSLRFGLGHHHHSHGSRRVSHEEIGLPSVSRRSSGGSGTGLSPRATTHIQPSLSPGGSNGNNAMIFEVTPPEERASLSSCKNPGLRGTIV